MLANWLNCLRLKTDLTDSVRKRAISHYDKLAETLRLFAVNDQLGKFQS